MKTYKDNADYYVRYGYEGYVLGRTDYLNEQQAHKEFIKMRYDKAISWAELIHEPLDCDEGVMIEQYEKKKFEIAGNTVYLYVGSEKRVAKDESED